MAPVTRWRASIMLMGCPMAISTPHMRHKSPIAGRRGYVTSIRPTRSLYWTTSTVCSITRPRAGEESAPLEVAGGGRGERCQHEVISLFLDTVDAGRKAKRVE